MKKSSSEEVSPLFLLARMLELEPKMNCIKRLGERLMSRTFERQVGELHIRAAILHRFTELGSGGAWPEIDLCNNAALHVKMACGIYLRLRVIT